MLYTLEQLFKKHDELALKLDSLQNKLDKEKDTYKRNKLSSEIDEIHYQFSKLSKFIKTEKVQYMD